MHKWKFNRDGVELKKNKEKSIIIRRDGVEQLQFQKDYFNVDKNHL